MTHEEDDEILREFLIESYESLDQLDQAFVEPAAFREEEVDVNVTKDLFLHFLLPHEVGSLLLLG